MTYRPNVLIRVILLSLSVAPNKRSTLEANQYKQTLPRNHKVENTFTALSVTSDALLKLRLQF